jgi:hypothetical protein
MANIPAFAPDRQDMVQWAWFVVMSRWMQGIYPYSGGAAAPASGMDISIDELISTYGTTAADASFTIDAHHDTLARVDVLYQTAAGAFAIHKGDNLAIVDPLGNYNASTHANWTQLESPYPKASIPAGVPMYLIFVAPAVTEIIAADLEPIAALGISGGNTKIRGEEPGGSGTALTLAHSPASGTLQLFKNGVRMKSGSGNGYTISGTDITLTTAKVAGDWFAADYEY